MADVSGNLPLNTESIFLPNGSMNPVWYRFFLQLFTRTGGGVGGIIAPGTDPDDPTQAPETFPSDGFDAGISLAAQNKAVTAAVDAFAQSSVSIPVTGTVQEPPLAPIRITDNVQEMPPVCVPRDQHSIESMGFVEPGNLDASALTTGILPVERGGTGTGAFVADAVLKGNGTSNVLASACRINSNNEFYWYKRLITNVAGTTQTPPSASGLFYRTDNVAAVTVTLPASAPRGAFYEYVQWNTGQITFVPAAGATLNNRQGHTKSAGRYALVRLTCVANTTGSAANWVLNGDTAA